MNGPNSFLKLVKCSNIRIILGYPRPLLEKIYDRVEAKILAYRYSSAFEEDHSFHHLPLLQLSDESRLTYASLSDHIDHRALTIDDLNPVWSSIFSSNWDEIIFLDPFLNLLSPYAEPIRIVERDFSRTFDSNSLEILGTHDCS